MVTTLKETAKQKKKVHRVSKCTMYYHLEVCPQFLHLQLFYSINIIDICTGLDLAHPL